MAQDESVFGVREVLLDSPAMRQIDAVLRQVGLSDVPVLLQGETGVGKEVLARQLHAHSNRASRPSSS